MTVRALVVAKAPVPGLAKTRLAADVGYAAAADLAAAALLDTLDACWAAFPDGCHLALAGDLADSARRSEIRAALRGWQVFAQEGDTLGDRLANAHAAVGRRPGPLVQVGMDTPQATVRLLRDAARRLRPGAGVVGPAVDGGWWLLGLADPSAARAVANVPMSTNRTGEDTCASLEAHGVRVRLGATLRDVDTVEDAEVVARVAPRTRFAAAWRLLRPEAA